MRSGPDGEFLRYWSGVRIWSSSVAELDLAPGAAGLDVGEDALQVPDPGREMLHLAEALVDGLEALGDDGLKLSPRRRSRVRLQLLVDGRAHLLELCGVLGAEHRHLLLEGLAQVLAGLAVDLAEGGEALLEALVLAALDVLHADGLGVGRLVVGLERGREGVAEGADLAGDAVGEAAHLGGDFLAEELCRVAGFAARARSGCRSPGARSAPGGDRALRWLQRRPARRDRLRRTLRRCGGARRWRRSGRGKTGPAAAESSARSSGNGGTKPRSMIMPQLRTFRERRGCQRFADLANRAGLPPKSYAGFIVSS